MLLVLGTLVISVTAVVALARVALAARLHADTARDEMHTDTLLNAAEAPILDWLHRHSGRATLPPDAVSPMLDVLDDRFVIGNTTCHITITAFDQCGMIGQHAVRTMSSLLPPHIFRVLERNESVWADSPGLDLLVAVSQDNLRVYPTPHLERESAIGAILATHNPARPGRPAAVNINTAPIPLVGAVYAARGMGGLDAIVEARSTGRLALPGAMTAPQQQSDLPIPVAMSTAWAFRIDVIAGSIRRSWWCVYADTGSNWERVQRLAITE